MRRILLMAVGFISFGLGSIGVLLPILPTTPFLLLSAYCFTRSSKRFDVWLRNTRLYRIYIADYMETRTIPCNRKWKILINIYLLMSFSILFAPLLPIKIGLALLTVGITIGLFVIIPSKWKKTVWDQPSIKLFKETNMHVWLYNLKFHY